MRRRRQAIFLFMGSCAMLQVGLWMSPSDAATPPRGQSNPVLKHVGTRTICLTDVFSGPLPGKADYCLGLRDWNDGNYRNGLEFLKLAAGWGNKNAQYTLGLIYYSGHHVATNPALGIAWLKLANERHNDVQIARVMQSALQSAEPPQRQHAARLYAHMKKTYGDKVAAARAWHRLQHWQRTNGPLDSGCVRVYGAQAQAARRLGLAGQPPQSIQPLLFFPPTGVAGGDHDKYVDSHAGVCVTIRTRHEVAQQVADKYFAGWLGVVTVGPLKVVPASAASSAH